MTTRVSQKEIARGQLQEGEAPAASRTAWRTTPCELYDLGYVEDYGKVWNLQKLLLQKRIDREGLDCLILVEHGHVITLGRSSHSQNVLARDLPIYEVERGGDVTYHGPGQIVAYPIVSLEERSMTIRRYVEGLETVVVRTLKQLGIDNCMGKLGRETGVWVAESRKIASIGVAVSHWTTYHGVALNVSTDLDYFRKMNPCGFDSSVMTSVEKELRQRLDLDAAKPILLEHFSNYFGWDFEKDSRSQIPHCIF